MTEASRFWNSNDVGDGLVAGYERELISRWLKSIFARGGSGILHRIGNELSVSGDASPLSVADGAALVDGLFYENDAAVELTVTTPIVDITGGRVILRANWNAQTVRTAVLLNTDGVADIPDLTQISETTYEINLASFTITTGGVISNLVVDTARVSFSTGVQSGQIGLPGVSVLGNSESSAGDGEAITAGSDGLALRRNGTDMEFGQIGNLAISDDAITAGKIAAGAVDDEKVGERVPYLSTRQGGNASDWNSPGSSNYTPGAVRTMAGVKMIQINAYDQEATGDVTLPVALVKPIVLLSVQKVFRMNIGVDWQPYLLFCEIISDTVIRITVRQFNYHNNNVQVDVAWLAIGPEA